MRFCAVIAVLALIWAAVLYPGAGARAELARVGGEFQINASTFSPSGARVAALPSGGFLVVWAGYGADGDGWGLLGRRFNAGAEALGTEFLVNATTMGDQVTPFVAAARDGSFFVMWNTGYEGAGRAFDPEGNALGPDVVIAEPQHPYGYPATSVAAGAASSRRARRRISGSPFPSPRLASCRRLPRRAVVISS